MGYLRKINLNVNNIRIRKVGQADLKSKKIMILIKKHKIIATITIICGILIILDCVLVHMFFMLLQTLY